ncbi:MAG: sigma-54 dependent transcriptional regulator [Pseudomonadota bacterium]
MNRKPRILVIDDDPTWLEQVPMILEGSCDVDTYETIDQGLQAVSSHFYDVVLLDLNFEGDSRSGLDIFRKIHSIDRETDVIVISGETDHKRLIEIFNAGVAQFVPKMSSVEEIRQAVDRALQDRETRRRASEHLTQKSKTPLIGGSPQMQKLRSDIARAIKGGTKDVLLQGETGTGKELVAQSIAFEADPARRFVVIHCGAVSDGLAESEFFGHVRGAFTGAERDRVGAFEAAGGGFVFLDEIGELPLAQQAKLLRVLQERKVQPVGTHKEKDVSFRCIAATHVNLEEAVKGGKFREDLYYRVAKDIIRIPSLRERVEDIPELVHYFLGMISKPKRPMVTPEAMRLLQSYSWPGNVRQLKAVVESLANSDSAVIREKDIYHTLPEANTIFTAAAARALVGSYGASIVMSERERYEKAIIKTRGSRVEAAKLLGISRATFFRRAKDLGLVKSRINSQELT